ncbi:MAG TPA: single-stranded DNA-binding protein [Marmoricola sp.]|jgi:single-strand DNA-binding protein|nr:single-stranded DNA-binding protein [Marmoricola sp.]
MNETYVTLQGWVGNDVETRDVGNTKVASFRVGSTPRYLRNGEWTNGETQWYTINCWRSLGRNVEESVGKGDAVIVHGRVRVDVWQRDGQPPSVSWIVDATFVGHDLTKGTSTFAKTPKSAGGDPVEDEGVREMVHAYEPAGPQLNSRGEEVTPAA